MIDARVGDTEDGVQALTLAWSGADVDLDLTPDTDGTLTSAVLFPAGTHTLTLSATDLPGRTTEASVTFEVLAPE